jgi:hypothetical protein
VTNAPENIVRMKRGKIVTHYMLTTSVVADHLSHKQRVGCAQRRYLQAIQEFPAAIVVKTVAVATSKRQRASPS